MRIGLTVIGLAAALLGADTAREQKLQKAIDLLEAKGDVRSALPLLEEAARSTDRGVAARALLHLAQAQEKNGKDRARATYERITRDFADQREAAAQARQRIAALRNTPAKPMSEPELTVRRVWVPPSHNLTAGSISADGRFLSYAEHFSGGHLSVRDLVTGEIRRVAKSPGTFREYASRSMISPDQKRIAYTWKTPERWELRVIDWDGSNARPLYASPDGGWLAPAGWSPDGRKMLLQIDDGRRGRQIAWLAKPEEVPRALKTFAWQALGEVTAVSPDGFYIAYDVRNAEGKARTVFLLASDGSSESAVTDGSAVDEVFGWMPDGKTLLFASNRTGARELWAVPVERGKKAGTPYVLKSDLGEFAPVGVAKDGSLFLTRYTVEGQAYTASINWSTGKMSAPAPIARGFVADNGADYSPDGKQIAYVAHRGTGDGERFLVVHSLDSGQVQEVRPRRPLHIVSGGSFSPDGKSYLVGGRDEKQRPGLYTIDIATGDVRLVVQADANVQQPYWFPDGKRLVYVVRERTPERSRVFVRNLESGVDSEIDLGVPNLTRVTIALSPDGRQLAFMSDNRYLHVKTLSGGAARQLHDVGSEGGAVQAWTPDSRNIVFLRANRTGPKLTWTPAWIPASGGEVRVLEGPLDWFRFHPDGDRIVSARRDLGIEFWAMQNIAVSLRAQR